MVMSTLAPTGSGGLDQDSIIATSILGAFFILVLVSIIIVTTYIVVKKCSLSSVAISDLRDESMPEITGILTMVHIQPFKYVALNRNIH